MDGRLVPKTERECIAFRRTLGYVFSRAIMFQHLSAQENIALVAAGGTRMDKGGG